MNLTDSQPKLARHDSYGPVRPARRRFTLVEAVLATTLTLIVLASASSLLYFNLLAASVIDVRMATTNIARNRVEVLRSLSFTDLALAAEDGTRVNSVGVPDPKGLYLRSTTIGTAVLGSRPITVTAVCPRKNRRPEISLTLTTILMDNSLIAAGGGS